MIEFLSYILDFYITSKNTQMLGREICLSEGQRPHWAFCDGLEFTDENVRKMNIWKILPFPSFHNLRCDS